MTKNQRWLLAASKDMLAFLDRKASGALPLGMYEDLQVKRTLSKAIRAVEDEDRQEVSAA